MLLHLLNGTKSGVNGIKTISKSCGISYFTGSFLAMVMRMISLGFDLEVTDRGQKKNPRTQLPNVVEYTGYCLFPTTSIFGPFIVYNEHMKFLEPSPIVILATLLTEILRGIFNL